MSRREFIESHGATCANWMWSWSFVNHADRFVIFGAWDVLEEGNRALILAEDWSFRRGRHQPAYKQAREHIRLVEEAGYRLKTFSMKRGAADPQSPGGPAKILGFTPKLIDKSLVRVGQSWYASEDGVSGRMPEEIDSAETVMEGAVSQVRVNRFERSAEGRRRCLAKNGHLCTVCDFDFERAYGPIGRGYIHVHHTVPLSEIGGEYELSPETDLVPVCPNCHAMIHSTRPAMTVEQLRKHLVALTSSSD
jgi:5-methylcytosine-specific restriction enzyme A